MQTPSLPKNLGNFSFVVDGKSFTSVMKMSDEVIKFSNADKIVEDLNLVICNGDNVYLVGRTIDTLLVHRLDAASIEGQGAARIDFKSLASSARSGTVKFTAEDGVMSLRTGKSLLRTDMQRVSLDQMEMLSTVLATINAQQQGAHLSADTVSAFKQAVDMTYVPNLYFEDAKVNSYLTVESGNFTCVTHDHMACSKFTSKVDTGDMRIALSAEMLRLVYKVTAKEEDTEFYTDNGAFIASSADFLIRLPAVRSTDQDYAKFNLCEEIMGSKVAHGSFDSGLGEAVKAITDLVNSHKKLRGTGVSIDFIGKGKGNVLLHFNTDGQSLTEKVTFGGKSEFKFKTDVRVLNLCMKNVSALVKDNIVGHEFSLYGPPGKYKAFRLDYSATDFHLSYYLMCSSV